MRRILVIRGGAIGDFVLTLPAVKLLRDAYPQAGLEILGSPHIAALAEKRFYADAVRSIEAAALARFFAEDSALPQDLVGYFGAFDLVVSYLFDPDKIFERNVRRCGVKKFLACSPQIHGAEHAARQLARPLEELGLILKDHAPKLFPSAAEREFARGNFPEDRTISLHPGSGSVRKNWPLEHWIALIDQLPTVQPESTLLIIGGEADEGQLTKLQSAFSDRVRFAKNLDLVHLAAVLERGALFIGHDSGISHLAAAVGTPSLLLFGQTDPTVWAPADATVIQSRTGLMSDISVADVENAANRALRTDAHRHQDIKEGRLNL